MQVVLTIVDTTGIQDYIFSSNRLRENIGASYLVEQATHDWVYEALPTPNNVSSTRSGEINVKQQLAEDNLAAELIYAGGGNALILFRSLLEAQTFARDLSRRVLREAPELEIVIAHSEPFDWSPRANDLKESVRRLREGRLTSKKRTRQSTSTSLLGLGVTAECSSTGLVATRTNAGLEPNEAQRGSRLISRGIAAKLEAVKKARTRLRTVFEKVDAEEQFEFSYELDHLSRTGGEESYIAVVHIDGNDMGGFIKRIADSSQNNLDYIRQMRDFSRKVKEAATEALSNTLEKLRNQIHKVEDQTSKNSGKGQKDKWVVTEVVPKRVPTDLQPQQKITLYVDEDSQKPCWPILPIVFGGDDLTFVCNGQLGLSLATIYMREFAAQTKERFGTCFHTGAGICVVKVHYPFRRAYSFSEQLTKNAKSSLGRERPYASALDWHFSTTGLSGSLSFIREREYETTGGSLLMRPVRFTQSADWHTWENFNRLVAIFNYDERWAGRRNKLKALREALREGESAVTEFRATYLKSEKLPELHNGTVTLQETGWDGRRCAYFDALEAMDHHFLLEDLS